MPEPRQVLLFDHTLNQAWNERMVPGEYAVHYSSYDGAPCCTVLPGLDEADAYARLAVAQRPTLRCMVYNHEGLFAPVRDIRGVEYKSGSVISQRFRRWVGSALFFGGVFLLGLDWVNDFKLNWPALVGARIVIPGCILLVTEVVLILHARQDSQKLAANS